MASALALIGGCTTTGSPELIPTSTATATSVLPTPTATPLPGEPYVVGRGALAATLEVRGSLAPSRQALLFFLRSGWVKKLFIEGGDQVEEGQLLAEIEVFGLEEKIEDEQFALDRARLLLERAIALRAEISQLKLERVQLNQEIADLHIQLETDALLLLEWQIRKRMAELDILVALRELQAAQLDVDLAQQSVDQAQARLDRSTRGLDEIELTASFSGVILSVEKRIGEGISPFDPIGILADVSELQIEVQVLEEEIEMVSLEQPAEVVLDAFPETPFQATVSQVSGQSIIWQGQKAFKVLLALEPGQRVPSAIGMGADVTVTTRKQTDALLVPNEALWLEGGNYYVDLIEGEAVRRHPVTLGISNVTHTEVIAGLQDGDTILIP